MGEAPLFAYFFCSYTLWEEKQRKRIRVVKETHADINEMEET